MTLERECFADSTKGMEAWIKADEMRKALEGAVEALKMVSKDKNAMAAIEMDKQVFFIYQAIAAGEEALK